MKVLVASSVCWTICTSRPQLAPGHGRVALQEPVHDLGLEHDVGQRLRRPVVHGPGDLAAQVLLGGQDDPGQRGWRLLGGTRGRRVGDADALQPIGERRQGGAVAGEGLALALQDVDLRLHEHGAPGQGHERAVAVHQGRRVGVGAGTREPLGGRGALLLVAGGLGPRLAHEHLDLGELAVERVDLGAHLRRDRGGGTRRGVAGHG